MSKASEDKLGELHGVIATELASIIAEGATVMTKDGDPVKVSAGPAYFGAAIAFLKNNNITADPATDAGLLDLQRTLSARRKDRKASLTGLDEAADAFAAINGSMIQ